MIHSFWLPELAGTQDVVPGQTNHLYLEADEPGTYEGQCKEFCGLSHAYMEFTVVAHTPADYEAWVAEQQRAGREPGVPATPPRASTRSSNVAVRRPCHAIDGAHGRGRQAHAVANGGRT